MTNTTDYYCSQKFWWLSLDIEKFQTYSCCSATPQKINFVNIQRDTGQLFNTAILQRERQDMLNGVPVESCAATCWRPESNGLISRRLLYKSDQRTHQTIQSNPEMLNIIVGSDCNMTCVYCCKKYSSSWRRDVQDSAYQVETLDDRFKFTKLDQLSGYVKQKQISRSRQIELLLDEIDAICQQQAPKEIHISGGEPFLWIELESLLSRLPSSSQICIFTGLGVNQTRFQNQLKILQKYTNVTVEVSAESVGPLYEFVRSGNTWDRFCDNIRELDRSGIFYSYNAVVSNLTVLGIADFEKFIGNKEIEYSICQDPDFLAVHVLDETTKDWVRKNTNNQLIMDAIDTKATDLQIKNLYNYITDFANRRSIDLAKIYPESFIKWISNVVQ